MDKQPFDFLVGVVFDRVFQVQEAVLVPFEVAYAQARFSKHVNGHCVDLSLDLLAHPDVRDVTELMRKAAEDLCLGTATT
jgi:hypothetical protein